MKSLHSITLEHCYFFSAPFSNYKIVSELTSNSLLTKPQLKYSMGSGCGKSSDSSQVINPSANNTNSVINDELAVYLSLDSPYNVNHKYAMFFPILSTLLRWNFPLTISGNQRTGSGIRETFAYKSKIPESELKKKRQEYWGMHFAFIQLITPNRDESRRTSANVASIEKGLRNERWYIH